MNRKIRITGRIEATYKQDVVVSEEVYHRLTHGYETATDPILNHRLQLHVDLDDQYTHYDFDELGDIEIDDLGEVPE